MKKLLRPQPLLRTTPSKSLALLLHDVGLCDPVHHGPVLIVGEQEHQRYQPDDSDHDRYEDTEYRDHRQNPGD